MSFKRASWVDQKSYKDHIPKIFCSKCMTIQKVDKILANNLLTNLKPERNYDKSRAFWSYGFKFEPNSIWMKGFVYFEGTMGQRAPLPSYSFVCMYN